MIKINLLPLSERRRLKISRLQSFVIKSYFLIIIFVVLIGFGLSFLKNQLDKNIKIIRQQTQVEKTNVRNPQVKDFRDMVENINKSLTFYSSRGQDNNHFTPKLLKILSLMPGSLNVEKLTYAAEAETLTLEGMSGNRQELLDYTKALKNMEIIKSLEEPLANLEKRTDGYFVIKITLK